MSSGVTNPSSDSQSGSRVVAESGPVVAVAYSPVVIMAGSSIDVWLLPRSTIQGRHRPCGLEPCATSLRRERSRSDPKHEYANFTAWDDARLDLSWLRDLGSEARARNARSGECG